MGFGLVARWIERGRRQDAIVLDIEKRGGTVTYDYEYDENGKWIMDAQPAAPAWIRRMCGNGCFVEVTELLLSESNIRGFDLSRLRELTSLKYVDVAASDVSDEMMREIWRLDSLEELRLDDNDQITDAALEHIGRMRSLKRLNVSATSITDDGLKSLRHLENLEELCVWHTEIGDQGVSHLAELPSLRLLDLSFTKITDDALLHLREFDRLEDLTLSGTSIGDKNLVQLREIPNLTYLDLSYTDVTDDGLPALRLGGLQFLRISDTEITYDAAVQLRAEIPDCTVQHWD